MQCSAGVGTFAPPPLSPLALLPCLTWVQLISRHKRFAVAADLVSSVGSTPASLQSALPVAPLGRSVASHSGEKGTKG
ncbi:hypothetical protein GQ53DRAFT_473836 [Thozetella sp. PMI_491]|nr:hypothetical protein GQ53DRAFT_473836 [Thozetella sp. PMI_491]